MASPDRVNQDGAFRLCVHFSQFTAKFDDGRSVDVPRQCDEWVVDCRSYNLKMLENDLKARLNWGSGQQPVIHEFDMSGGGERNLLNDTELSLAFSERMGEKKLFLFVDVEDRPIEVFCRSVTELAASNVGHDNVTGPIDSSKEAFVSHAIDWDSLEIIPLGQDQIGDALPVMDEDAMYYEFVGLRVEDERAEQARMAAEINLDDVDLQDAELLVDDRIPGEDVVLYDREDPPMKAGTIYANMNEFKANSCSPTIRSKFMELYARRRRIGEKFEGHVMLPIVVHQLYAMSR